MGSMLTTFRSGLTAAGEKSSAAVKSLIESWRGPRGAFEQVFETELQAVSKRRAAHAEEKTDSSGEQRPSDHGSLPAFDNPCGALKEVLENQGAAENAWRVAVEKGPAEFRHTGLVGLALSGGGIRSATFNLGVLQMLDSLGIFRKLDYLSTVSGGGYIGCCLGSLYATGQNDFPFRHHCGEVENQRFKHLREYSNYISPHGILDRLRMPALFVRGLFLNFLLLLPFILAAASVYVLMLQSFPAINLMFRDFFFTSRLLAILAGVFSVYPIAKRIDGMRGSAGADWPVRERLTRGLGFYFGTVLVVAFVEAQPHVIDFYDWLSTLRSNNSDWLRKVPWSDLIGGLVALGGVISAFVAARGASAADATKKKTSLLLVGILGPVLLWLLFIALAKWALHPGEGQVEQAVMALGAWAQQLVAGPSWLPVLKDGSTGRAAWYLEAGFALYLLGLFVNVNDYSLHGFYRDRLSKAYLMKSGDNSAPPGHNDKQSLASATSGPQMPYHIINAALNVTRPEKEMTGELLQRPGRTAESFFFTRDFAGSDATSYCKTSELEKRDPWFNLGTAMAISGAAFAPNMGHATMKPLVFVLTMLNVRLCYWLLNPRIVNSWPLRAWFKFPGRWLLFKELFSTLDASDRYVNLSDGGHMDNLGVYELLRRRCRLIIVSDAEADQQYQLEGLATVCRLAQIDMGIEIEFDKQNLDDIREGRRHYALGRIHYTDKVEGWIIYLKASTTLSGDSVYIDHYQKLHPDFPHETTMDQFYDEEQFECYRALGYDVARRVFAQ